MTRCPRCSAELSYGLRYGLTPDPVQVRICWACGWESGDLACCQAGWTLCPCGEALYATPAQRRHGMGKYCSKACLGRYVHALSSLKPHRFKTRRVA